MNVGLEMYSAAGGAVGCPSIADYFADYQWAGFGCEDSEWPNDVLSHYHRQWRGPSMTSFLKCRIDSNP